MTDTKQKPSQNAPNSLDEEQKDVYIITTVEKFLDEYVFSATNDGDDACTRDGVLSYSVNLMASFLLLADLKDAVKSGNGEYLAVLRKQLLVHFFSTPGYNEFAIEMLINILQCQVLLTEAEVGLGGLPVFRFYFQTGFFGLAFTKIGKPSLRNCLLSSPETRS